MVMAKATVDVAIAILLHKSKVLVGWRQANQHQGNKHEFLVGKLRKVKHLNKLAAERSMRR